MYPADIRAKLTEAMNPEAEKVIAEKNSQYPDSFENKTIIIECARGGKQGSEMPLTGSTGYQYYFKNLAPDLLSNAAVLYVQVTPEESRRKNAARFDPNDPDSSLFHSTPEKVMDGYEATREIRKLQREDAATVKIIAMTADAFNEDVQKCLDAGMNGHIAKPVDPVELYALLIEYMR